MSPWTTGAGREAPSDAETPGDLFLRSEPCAAMRTGGMDADASAFKICSTCRRDIGFGAEYFQCSVSTCNRKRTALFFCSVACWDAHRSEASHRDAWAERAVAPSREAWRAELAEQTRKAKPTVDTAGAQTLQRVRGGTKHEVLIVVARLKDYVRVRATMNLSERGLPVLSDHIRDIADLAIAAAGRDGRKTVMDRDIAPLFAREARNLATGDAAEDASDEILIVVSKFKKYVKERGGMNTSDSVARVLSNHVRHLTREAIRHAARDDRRTVLGRDFAAVIGDPPEE